MSAKKKAGHRRWAARGGQVLGGNRGDIMSPEKRSQLMARIHGKNTGPERVLAQALKKTRLRFERHAADLPGKPDFVFRRCKLVVFVDGSFWHGWRFPLWEGKLTDFWRTKIATNRSRDRRNFSALRRAGWKVVRIWEHQIEANVEKCIARVLAAARRDSAMQHDKSAEATIAAKQRRTRAAHSSRLGSSSK